MQAGLAQTVCPHLGGPEYHVLRCAVVQKFTREAAVQHDLQPNAQMWTQPLCKTGICFCYAVLFKGLCIESLNAAAVICVLFVHSPWLCSCVVT